MLISVTQKQPFVTDAVCTTGARPWCNSRQVDMEGKQYGFISVGRYWRVSPSMQQGKTMVQSWQVGGLYQWASNGQRFDAMWCALCRARHSGKPIIWAKVQVSKWCNVATWLYKWTGLGISRQVSILYELVICV